MYRENGEFFSSIRLTGKQPLTSDMILRKSIRPACVAAGIIGKVIGLAFISPLAWDKSAFHGVDIKVAQELLRHASSRTTLDLYTRPVSADKRDASNNHFDMLMGDSASVLSSVPSAA
jgi:hypothetical protein